MNLTWDGILRAHHVQFLDLAVSPDDSCVVAVLGDNDPPYLDYSVDIMRRVIVRVDLATGEARQLTDPDEDAHAPAWSPGGKALAYLSRASESTEIWTMAKDGTSRRQLTHSKFPARNPFQNPFLWWTPDGGGVVYTVLPNGSRRALADQMAEDQPDHGPAIYTPDVARRREERMRERLQSQVRRVNIRRARTTS